MPVLTPHYKQIEEQMKQQSQMNAENEKIENRKKANGGPASKGQSQSMDSALSNLWGAGVKEYMQRSTRLLEQGAYQPEGQFWMMFWDFILNYLTQFLLTAGYLDINKIGVDPKVNNNVTPTGIEGYYGLPPSAAKPAEAPKPKLDLK